MFLVPCCDVRYDFHVTGSSVRPYYYFFVGGSCFVCYFYLFLYTLVQLDFHIRICSTRTFSNNTTGATNEAGTAYALGAPESIPV